MRKFTLSLIAIAALCIVPFGRCIVQAQEVGKGDTHPNAIYLFDLVPTKIDGNKPSESTLTLYWRPDKCTLNGMEYPHSVSFGYANYNAQVSFPAKGYDYFDAVVGVEKPRGITIDQLSVRYIVLGDDNKRLFTSPTLNAFNTVFRLHVRLKGNTELSVKAVTDGLNMRYVWWGDARMVEGTSPDPELTPPMPGPQDDIKKPMPFPQPSGETYTFDIRDIDDLAKKLKTQVDEDKDQFKVKPVEVAVASFDLIPKTLSPDNARKVREQLTIALTKTKTFKVIERGQLDKIFGRTQAQQVGHYRCDNRAENW